MNQKSDKSKSIKNRSKRGGKRAGSGRKPGVPNKITRSLKEMANEHSEEALGVLVEIMKDPEAPHSARVMAADKVLDRAHGKPPVSIEKSEVGITPIPWDELREIRKKSIEKAAQRHREVIEGRYERLGIERIYHSD